MANRKNLNCVAGAMLIRKRGQILGTIEAPHEQAVEQVAAERDGPTKEQLTRRALRKYIQKTR